MSKLLINETPLQFLPTLAIALGSERKAIALQQLHYMLTTPRMSEEREGHRWVRASYTDWFLEFYPCWSPDTVRKLYSALRADGFVLHRQFGIKAGDATSYLSIDYEKLDAAHAEIIGTHPAKLATCHPAISVEDHPAVLAASSISKKRGKEKRERGGASRPARPPMDAPPSLKNQKPPNSKRPAWMGPVEPDPRISAWRAFTTNAPLNKVQEDAILSQVSDCALWESILKTAMLYHTRANVAKFLGYYAAGEVPVFGEAKGAPAKNAAESWLDAAKMNGWDVAGMTEGMVTHGN